MSFPSANCDSSENKAGFDSLAAVIHAGAIEEVAVLLLSTLTLISRLPLPEQAAQPPAPAATARPGANSWNLGRRALFEKLLLRLGGEWEIVLLQIAGV